MPPRSVLSVSEVHVDESTLLRLAASSGGIAAVELGPCSQAEFLDRLPVRLREGRVGEEHLACAGRQLREYFARTRTSFDVPVDLATCSSFQYRVLVTTADIPFGDVITYGELATAIGSPGAARAIGGALNRNPVPILIPCHRVISARGLGGFGSGIGWKRRLLHLEGGVSGELSL